MRLPLTVIGGYLGAGKTTLLNRLLMEDHGLRLMVMVNDFGAVNIDVQLLEEATEDRIELSNGCVCCTMGADLFAAIGDVLDRPQRPDHVLIEASGVADPGAIAQLARTEPDLAYGGIITVIDGLGWTSLCQDPLVGAQLQGQSAVADLRVVTKTPQPPDGLPAPILMADTLEDLATPLLGLRPVSSPRKTKGHAAYASWSTHLSPIFEAQALLDHLARRPVGLFRLKGFVPAQNGQSWEVHCVGQTNDIKPVSARPAQLVGIGLSERLNTDEIDAWWAEATR